MFDVPSISLVKSESYFSDFNVKNQKVYLDCYITLKNISNTEKTVKLTASFPDDVNTGLLKESILPGLNKNNKESKFIIHPNSQKSFNVTFVGDFAGTIQRHERLLPKVNITVVK